MAIRTSNHKGRPVVKREKYPIDRYPPRTMELAQQGDIKAQHEVVRQALGLVQYRARHWVRIFPRLDHGDLVAVGVIGVYDAIRCFRPERGKFSMVAWLWIDARMRAFITKEVNADSTWGDMSFFTEHDTSGQTQRVDCDSSHYAMPDAAIKAPTTVSYQPQSPDENLDPYLLDSLNPLEKDAIECMVMRGMSQVEFGKRYGCQQPWASKLKKRILEELRRNMD